MSAACRAVLRSQTAVTSTEFLLFPTKSCIRKLSRGPRLVQRCAGYAAVAHLVERHLAKVEVASSSLVGRSNRSGNPLLNMVTWPSGKARVCKTLIHQFKSGRHLQKIPGSFGFRDFLFCAVPGMIIAGLAGFANGKVLQWLYYYRKELTPCPPKTIPPSPRIRRCAT